MKKMTHDRAQNWCWSNPYVLFVIPFFLYLTSLFNTWHFVDDHEIALFLASRDFSFTEKLSLTEVFQWGEFKRFRPSYFSLRIFESWLWGDRLYLWYTVRLFIQFFFIREIYLWAKTYLTQKESVVVLLLGLSLIFWRDLQTRLGPGETYCVLGLTLISVALRLGRMKWLYFIGALIAMGSKENFIITPVLLMTYLISQEKFRVQDAAYHFLLFIFGLFIGIGIIKAISVTGTDLYMKKVDPASRMLALFPALLTVQLIPYLGLVLAFLKKRISFSRQELVSLSIVFFVLTFNIIFYNGEMPRGNRYDFPAVPLNLVAWIIFYKKCGEGLLLSSRVRKAFSLLLAAFVFSGCYRQFTKSWSRHKETKAFAAQLDGLVSKSKGFTRILFVTDTVKDFELSTNVTRFMRYRGSTAEMFLRVPELRPKGPHAQALAREMNLISRKGLNGFLPIGDLRGNCLQVNFQASVELKECEAVQRF